MPTCRIVGPGRVGRSLAGAAALVGWEVRPLLGRGDPLTGACDDVDLVVIATPDDAVATVVSALGTGRAVVAHLSGSLGLDVLGDRPCGSLHPLATIPDEVVGVARLRSGIAFAVAGDPIVRTLAVDLGGRPFTVADDDRAAYHAAACVASNHLVALFGQVERIAASIGLPVDAFLDIAQQALDGVGELGPAAALTGPVARGDLATVARHLEHLDVAEHRAYLALADQAARLVGRELGDDPLASKIAEG